MMMEWSNDLCTIFMQQYQKEPMIWDPKHKYYKDKTKVKNAWDRISKELNIPVPELKNKKMSLMATFRAYRRKKKASIKASADINDVYQPMWFLYELMDSFLCNIYEGLPTISTEEQGNNSQPAEIESIMIEEYLMPQSPMAQSSRPQSPIASPSQQLLPAQQRRRQAKSSDDLINEAGKQMKDTFKYLNSVLKNQRTEEDDCDLYCKLLAKKLRRLPENERDLMMYEIDGIFVNRIRNLSSIFK